MHPFLTSSAPITYIKLIISSLQLHYRQNLTPENKGGGQMVPGTLSDMIEAQYGSVKEMTEKLSAVTVAVQGSGWGWLGYDKVNKRLSIATCANQVSGLIQCELGWIRYDFGVDSVRILDGFGKDVGWIRSESGAHGLGRHVFSRGRGVNMPSPFAGPGSGGGCT